MVPKEYFTITFCAMAPSETRDAKKRRFIFQSIELPPTTAKQIN